MIKSNSYTGAFEELAKYDLQEISDYTVRRLGGRSSESPLEDSRDSVPSTAFLEWVISAAVQANQEHVYRGIKEGALKCLENALDTDGTGIISDICTTLNTLLEDLNDKTRDEIRTDLRAYFIPEKDSRVSELPPTDLLNLIYTFSKSTTPAAKNDPELVAYWREMQEDPNPLKGLFSDTHVLASSAIALMGDVSESWWTSLNEHIILPRFNEYMKKRSEAPEEGPNSRIREYSPEDLYIHSAKWSIIGLQKRGILKDSHMDERIAFLKTSSSELANYEQRLLQELRAS